MKVSNRNKEQLVATAINVVRERTNERFTSFVNEHTVTPRNCFCKLKPKMYSSLESTDRMTDFSILVGVISLTSIDLNAASTPMSYIRVIYILVGKVQVE